MAATNNPEVLNKLLEEIILGLLDHSQSEFKGRKGKVFSLGRMQAMKLKVPEAAVKMGLRQLGRMGDPQKKFDLFVSLSNKFLPEVVEIIGQDVVIDRIDNLPERVRNRDIIRALKDGGATEVANLMGKALPGWESEQKAVAAATVAEPPLPTPEDLAREVSAKLESTILAPAEKPTPVIRETFQDKVEFIPFENPVGGDPVSQQELLKSLEKLHAQLGWTIAQMRRTQQGPQP